MLMRTLLSEIFEIFFIIFAVPIITVLRFTLSDKVIYLIEPHVCAIRRVVPKLTREYIDCFMPFGKGYIIEINFKPSSGVNVINEMYDFLKENLYSFCYKHLDHEISQDIQNMKIRYSIRYKEDITWLALKTPVPFTLSKE